MSISWETLTPIAAAAKPIDCTQQPPVARPLCEVTKRKNCEALATNFALSAALTVAETDRVSRAMFAQHDLPAKLLRMDCRPSPALVMAEALKRSKDLFSWSVPHSDTLPKAIVWAFGHHSDFSVRLRLLKVLDEATVPSLWAPILASGFAEAANLVAASTSFSTSQRDLLAKELRFYSNYIASRAAMLAELERKLAQVAKKAEEAPLEERRALVEQAAAENLVILPDASLAILPPPKRRPDWMLYLPLGTAFLFLGGAIFVARRRRR